MAAYRCLSVVMPCYNETATISEIVERGEINRGTCHQRQGGNPQYCAEKGHDPIPSWNFRNSTTVS